MKKKDFIGINHGTDRIDLRKYSGFVTLRPIAIHLKEDGDIDNGPSLALVMEIPNIFTAVGEISVKMFNEGLRDIGYKLVKLE